MLKSIMNYRFVTRKTLEKQLIRAKVNFPCDRKGDKAYTVNLKQLGSLLHKRVINLSPKNRLGIPQGTTVSEILANIYMIVFDEFVANLIENYHGLYRRYSDDFIIVIPGHATANQNIQNLKNQIIDKNNKMNKL